MLCDAPGCKIERQIGKKKNNRLEWIYNRVENDILEVHRNLFFFILLDTEMMKLDEIFMCATERADRFYFFFFH